MKNILIGILFILILPWGHVLQAQSRTPGYLGKRFQLGVGLSASPAGVFETGLRKYTATLKDWHKTRLFLKGRQEIQALYCLNRRSSLGIAVSRLRLSYLSYGFSFSPQFSKVGGRMKVKGLAITYRLFPFLRRGNLAPIGPFTQIQFSVFHTRLFSPFSNEFTPVFSRNLKELGLLLGYVAPFSDRVLFTYGFELNFPIFNVLGEPEDQLSGLISDPIETKKAVRNHTLFNFHLGISGLLF
ncbi:MAG TPA: hypothetical protein ENJ82_01090 [Bacteroidetes bacterium]|nr:hypothetical protein [Bacteroidota bacterium]